MRVRIPHIWPLLALALPGLAGCADGGLGLGRPDRSLALYGDAITIQGPEGYCVDRRASDPDSGFAVLGGCALLSNLPLMPASHGVITVQVAEAGSAIVQGAEAELAALLGSSQGAAVLAAGEDPSLLRVEAIDSGPGIVMAQLHDSGPPLAPGLQDTAWRAFLDLGGRLATVTLRGTAREPLDRDAALSTMTQSIQILRAANGMP